MSNYTRSAKYAAIASAVAYACAGGLASASTIDNVTLVASSKQSNAAASSTAELGLAVSSLSMTLNSSYAVNDQVILTIAGASFNTSASTGTTPASTVNCVAGTSQIVLGYLSKSSSAITYRVLSNNDNTVAASAKYSCNLGTSGLSFLRNSAVTTGVSAISLRLSGLTGSTSFDPQATVTTIGSVADQYTAIVDTGFNATIDVNYSRLAWLGASTPSLSQSLKLSFTSTTNSTDAAASAGTFIVDVYGASSGDPAFSFIDDGGGCNAAELTTGPGSLSVSGASLSISSNCATLTINKVGVVGQGTPSGSLTLTLSKASASTGKPLVATTFTARPQVSVTVTNTTSQDFGAQNAGTFTLNGASLNVPYMPYGLSGTQEISQSYYIANSSTTAGTVTGVAYNQAGASCNLGTVGTAVAKGVTNLSTAINAAIAGCYAGSATAAASAFPAGTRVYIDLTSNTPQASTQLNAAYNVGGNSRVNIVGDGVYTRARP